MKFLRPSSVALFTLLFALLPSEPSAAQAIWTSGHGGHKITYDGSNLSGVWSAAAGCVIDGSTTTVAQDFALGGLLPVMPFSESTVRPAGNEWDFIGTAAGEDIWIMPEVQEADLPWVGFNTKALVGADWTTPISITLLSVTGTGVDAGGEFSIYAVDAFSSPTPIYAKTSGGIAGAGISLAAFTGHLHANFAFTKPGDYTATYLISGTHVANGDESATASYTYRVIPEPGTLGLFLAGAGAMVGFSRRMRRP